MKGVGARQQELLALLLLDKAGKSLDEMASAVGVTRTAVQQHISALERNGFVEEGITSRTAGRPVQRYVITEKGIHLFPKQYSWFSELVLEDIVETQGAEGLDGFMRRLGAKTATSFQPLLETLDPQEKTDFLIKTMQDMGYQASFHKDDTNGEAHISACHCVYHNIAMKYDQVCAFDRALISNVLNKEVEQVSCMAKGGAVCRFNLTAKKES